MNTETIVGAFVVVGLVCFAFLAAKMGDIGGFNNDGYTLKARFLSTSGLKEGAAVEMAGVIIGKVASIQFDPEEYDAVVDMSLPANVKIKGDAIASVRSTGLIGGKFIKITPGGSEDFLETGGEIVETESSVSLEELISKYIFESGSDK